MISVFYKTADNSGVNEVLVITNLTRKNKKVKVGDLVVGIIRKVRSLSTFLVSKIVYAVVVRTKQGIYEDSVTTKFSENSLVLVDKNLNPLSSRIIGVIPSIIKNKGCLKLNSIAVNFI